MLLDEFLKPWIGLIYSHFGAKRVWSDLLGCTCKGFSNVRWYCKAEIAMEMALNWPLVEKAIKTFEDRDYGNAYTKSMRTIYESNTKLLQLEFAAMLDMRPLISTTYELEGDRLEVLIAYDKIEALREKGRRLGEDGSLPNADALLRSTVHLENGMPVEKYFPAHGMCKGRITLIDDPDAGGEGVNSTLEPGKVVTAYEVTYAGDGTSEDLEETEIRKILLISDHNLRKQLVTGLKKGFDYLEDRLLGKCQENYDCAPSYQVMSAPRSCLYQQPPLLLPI